MDDLSPRDFRRAMRNLCSPVAVVTSSHEGRPHGTTVGAFTPFSWEPPAVAVMLGAASATLARAKTTRLLGINILAWDHACLAADFAGATADRFRRARWYERVGLPQLHGVAGWLRGELLHSFALGDHEALFLRGREAQTYPVPPLLYHGKKFGTHLGLPPGGTRTREETP
ncbi:flavin reductase family protein [Streptomyces sp. NPDC059003]|uniref:flavin reductase family protein n=1 Tax=Streptomyces sp. NPDC059003 TaxID=3346691 RepID=UPI0036965406